MLITAQQLPPILPNAGQKAGVFAPVLNTAMSKYQIVTPLRIAAFIAQVGHESGQLRYVRELWGPTLQQLGYEGRKDLGNTVAGDDSKYRGRGQIQVTGRANYEACGEALGLDLINHPELLELPQHAAMSAAWFWHRAALNTLADKGDFLNITKRINGGTNGLADRQALTGQALADAIAYKDRVLNYVSQFVPVVNIWDGFTEAMTVEGLHPNLLGAEFISSRVVPIITSNFEFPGIPLPTDAGDVYSAVRPFGCLNANPLLAGTGGALPAGVNAVAGSVLADGYKAVGSGLAGITTR